MKFQLYELVSILLSRTRIQFKCLHPSVGCSVFLFSSKFFIKSLRDLVATACIVVAGVKKSTQFELQTFFVIAFQFLLLVLAGHSSEVITIVSNIAA